MQTLRKILTVNGGNSTITDEWGKTASNPEIKIGIAYAIDLDIRSSEEDKETGRLLPYPFGELSTATGFYLCLDGDWNHATTPKLFISSGISVYQDAAGLTHFRAELPNTAKPALLEAVAKNKTVTLNCEICGYAANGTAANAVFAFDFTLTLRNRIYIGDSVPQEVEDDPEYLTAAQVRALIAEATRPDAAKLSIGTVTSGNTAAAEITGTPPNQKLNLILQSGTDGATPRIGENGNWYINEKDTGVPVTGADGATPHIGENGNWHINEKDTGVPAAGQPGRPGEGMNYDASGTIAEKALYDSCPRGFKFATTEITSDKTVLYIYTKMSDALADWSTPLTFVFRGGTNSGIYAIKPIEFDPPPEGTVAEWYHFSLAKFPNVCVCHVAVDTADGELILPYYSDRGITRILKNKDEVYIYFGANMPSYTKGRIYLSQFVEAGSGTHESVIDRQQIIYGYIMESGKCRVIDLTAENLAASTVQKMAGAETGKVSFGKIPAGALLFVLIPSALNLTAKKDDGFGGKAIFHENNGSSGTGANGIPMSFGGEDYLAYGEFALIGGESYFYIEHGGKQ